MLNPRAPKPAQQKTKERSPLKDLRGEGLFASVERFGRRLFFDSVTTTTQGNRPFIKLDGASGIALTQLKVTIPHLLAAVFSTSPQKTQGQKG
jgi:hypothetical protein